MAIPSYPYHSIDRVVHHVFSDCTVGNNIERNKWRSGTGGKPLCDRCRRIRAGEISR